MLFYVQKINVYDDDVLALFNVDVVIRGYFEAYMYILIYIGLQHNTHTQTAATYRISYTL